MIKLKIKKGNVRVGKGEVKIFINPNFYSHESVANVSKIFKKSFKASTENLENNIIVTLKPKSKESKPSLKLVGYEFFNYLLVETRSRIKF